MNKESILFLTKDAQCKAYYPCYGNQYYKGKTPNMDELAVKGTLFTNFITAAPSSNMSYLSMFTMMYPYKNEIKRYEFLPKDFEGETLFAKAIKLGFECHIMWDSTWDPDTGYTRCYGGTTIHSIEDLRQGVGVHFMHEGKLVRNDNKAREIKLKVKKELESFVKDDKKVFLWCHLPHVLNGRCAYGDDIDLYDEYIGMFREFFSDDNIFISADHGNMNGLKGKVGYGFHVYEPAINIPLITPRIENLSKYDGNVCNIDVFDLIFNRSIPKREYVLSDSAYYAQPNRRLCVAYGKYRYIYNKIDGTEEFYDVEWDPNQNFNMIEDDTYDTDRKVNTPACEYIFYPYWEELPEIRKKLRQIKDDLWRTEDTSQRYVYQIKMTAKKIIPTAIWAKMAKIYRRKR